MRATFLVLSMAFAVPAAAQDIDNGQGLYMSRCAACHGEAAMGDGAMAALLTIPTPDLTQLAARNQGDYPRLAVVRAIDGEPLLRGHGGGGPMPVFGPVLGGGSAVLDGPDGSILETSRDVLDIALYIETLQGVGG